MLIHLRKLCGKSGWNLPSSYGDLFNFANVLSLFPFGKGSDLLLENTWIPSKPECIVPSFVKSGLVVLEKKMKQEEL